MKMFGLIGIQEEFILFLKRYLIHIVVLIFVQLFWLDSGTIASTWVDVVASKVACQSAFSSCTCNLVDTSGGGNVNYRIDKVCSGTGWTTRTVYCTDINCSGSLVGWGYSTGNIGYNCDGTINQSAGSYYNNAFPAIYIETEKTVCGGEKTYTLVFGVNYFALKMGVCPTSGYSVVNGGCSPTTTTYANFTNVQPCDPNVDPCCNNPDPCCGCNDPCCGKGACCRSNDPCCGSQDQYCGIPGFCPSGSTGDSPSSPDGGY
jgi:hypothetical protein